MIIVGLQLVLAKDRNLAGAPAATSAGKPPVAKVARNPAIAP